MFVGFLFVVGSFAAETATPVPEIKDDLKAKYWKAYSEYVVATTQSQRAQSNLVSIQTKLQEACGDKFTLNVNAEGDPICTEKPKTTTPVKENK